MIQMIRFSKCNVKWIRMTLKSVIVIFLLDDLNISEQAVLGLKYPFYITCS